MMEKVKVNDSRAAIFQESDMKNILEELDIKIDEAATASVDAFNMYLSIKLATTIKLVRFSQEKLPQNPRRQSTYAWIPFNLG